MSEVSHVQWFPGHMAKTRRIMASNLKLVDAVVEITDARIPFSSRNPEMKRIVGSKPRLVLLNKADSADPEVTAMWLDYYAKQGITALATDCRSGKNVSKFYGKLKELLKDGSQFGVNLTYAVQPSPDGLAQAFIIGEEFIGDDTVAMVLGDNIFAGHGLKKRLKAAVENAESGKGATVFGYYVDDPERFGIVEFNNEGKAVSIEEKPAHPKSNYCVTGLYFYDNKVVEYAKNLKPSARGELEITDLNRIYLEKGTLNVELLGQGFTWLDTGTHESLVEATNFVKTVETHQHRKIACLEEIAYLNGWINKDEVLKVYEVLKKNQYGQYLKDVLDGKYVDKLHE